MTTLSDLRNVLRNIADVAEDIQRRTQSPPASIIPPSSSRTETRPPNYLPELEPIAFELMTTGIDIKKATHLSDAFLRAGRQLQHIHISNTRKLLDKFLSMGSFSSAHKTRLLDVDRKLYLDRITAWRADIMRKAQEASHAPASTVDIGGKYIESRSDNERKHFNHDFVPVLERCFAKNQSPGKVDKMLLSERSGMTYQQIHIWFQNRRSRSKTDGDISELKQRPCILRVEYQCAPYYAFPTAYPPDIDIDTDPFPCIFGDFSRFANTQWLRRPSSRRPKESELDISALCLAFEGLRIKDAVKNSSQWKPRSSTKRSLVSSKGAGCDITSPYTVRPLNAPPVSLIRSFSSRVVGSPGKASDELLSSKCKLVEVSANNKTVRPTPRRPHRSPARESAVGLAGKNDSSPSSQSPETASAHITTSNESAPTSAAGAQPKTRKKSRKSTASRREHVASASKRVKKRSAPVARKRKLSSSSLLSSHPSPASSMESLPALSYSSTSSSASTCSQSPTLSFETLEDDGLIPSLDVYQSSGSCLHLPPADEYLATYQPPIFPSSNVSFGISKGPMDILFGLDLPTYPSFSDSLDSIQRGLQCSPDFAPPVLTFDFPSLEN